MLKGLFGKLKCLVGLHDKEVADGNDALTMLLRTRGVEVWWCKRCRASALRKPGW